MSNHLIHFVVTIIISLLLDLNELKSLRADLERTKPSLKMPGLKKASLSVPFANEKDTRLFNVRISKTNLLLNTIRW